MLIANGSGSPAACAGSNIEIAGNGKGSCQTKKKQMCIMDGSRPGLVCNHRSHLSSIPGPYHLLTIKATTLMHQASSVLP